MKVWKELKGVVTVSDKVLILCALAGIAATTIGSCDPSGNPRELMIEIGGGRKHVIPLFEDGEMDVVGPLGKTRIIVENHEAWIAESPCANKVCMAFGPVTRSGQMAVCLPNTIAIRVVGSLAAADLDAISR